MIPGGMFTGVPPSTFLAPNDLPYVPLSQTVWGGVAIGNPAGGRLVKYWVINYVNGIINVKPTDGPIAFTLTVANVLSVSLAFDNNMGLVISYMLADGAHLYYFDSVTSAYITRSFPGISSCRACVDDARSFYTSDSDVFFVYTLSGKLYYRQQRDRYDVAKYIRDTQGGVIRIGKNINNRFQIELQSFNVAVLVPPPIPEVTSVEGTLYVTPPSIPQLDSVEGTLYVTLPVVNIVKQFFTSSIFGIITEDRLTINKPSPVNGSLLSIPKPSDNFNIGRINVVAGTLRDVIISSNVNEPSTLQLSKPNIASGNLRDVIISNNANESSKLNLSKPTIITGTLQDVIVTYNSAEPSKLTLSKPTIVSGTLV